MNRNKHSKYVNMMTFNHNKKKSKAAIITDSIDA